MTKTAVITGGSSGLGRAIAHTFVAQGFSVFLCARTAEDLEATAEELRKEFPGAQVMWLAADLSVRSEVQRVARVVLEAMPRLDVLVNNAGVFVQGGVLTQEEGVLERLLDTNLMSAWHLTRALAPRMLEAGTGHIFNMCSVASVMAYPNGGAYSVSKYALLGFSRSLREELKPRGIKVTAVLPGATWSRSWEGAALPRERLMEPEDVARVVWAAWNLGDGAVVEELVLRPLAGDVLGY